MLTPLQENIEEQTETSPLLNQQIVKSNLNSFCLKASLFILSIVALLLIYVFIFYLPLEIQSNANKTTLVYNNITINSISSKGIDLTFDAAPDPSAPSPIDITVYESIFSIVSLRNISRDSILHEVKETSLLLNDWNSIKTSYQSKNVIANILVPTQHLKRNTNPRIIFTTLIKESDIDVNFLSSIINELLVSKNETKPILIRVQSYTYFKVLIDYLIPMWSFIPINFSNVNNAQKFNILDQNFKVDPFTSPMYKFDISIQTLFNFPISIDVKFKTSFDVSYKNTPIATFSFIKLAINNGNATFTIQGNSIDDGQGKIKGGECIAEFAAFGKVKVRLYRGRIDRDVNLIKGIVQGIDCDVEIEGDVDDSLMGRVVTQIMKLSVDRMTQL